MYFFCLPSVDDSHQRGTLSPHNLEKCSAVAEMGDRLATIDVGPKEGRGLLCPFLGRTGSPSNIGVKTSWRKISKNTKFMVYFMLTLVNIIDCTFFGDSRALLSGINCPAFKKRVCSARTSLQCRNYTAPTLNDEGTPSQVQTTTLVDFRIIQWIALRCTCIAALAE